MMLLRRSLGRTGSTNSRSSMACHASSPTAVLSGLAESIQRFFGPKMINGDRPLLQPRKLSPPMPVPDHIPKPSWASSGQIPQWSNKNQVHNEQGIQKMRDAGKLAAQVLDYAGTLVQPGTTTDQIDKAVHKMIIDNGAYPSPLNYGKFPKSVCTSVNECVCHGIPDDRQLQEGDIINIDVTVYLNGHHGDTSRMFFAGTPSPEARQLCEVTQTALHEAIKICGPGVPYNRIGKTINQIADKNDFGVVQEYVGHGVGQRFHSAPVINHTRNLAPGHMQLWQTFTIEPMLVQGEAKCQTWRDGWTVVTQDGGLSAQYEHTLLITPQGAEILTLL